MASTRAGCAAADDRVRGRVVQRRDQRGAVERVAGRDGACHGPARPGAGRCLWRGRDDPALDREAALTGTLVEQPGDVRGGSVRWRAGGVGSLRQRRGDAQQGRLARRPVRADRADRRCGAADPQLRSVRAESARQRRSFDRSSHTRTVPPVAAGGAGGGGDRDDARARVPERWHPSPLGRHPGFPDLPPSDRRTAALGGQSRAAGGSQQTARGPATRGATDARPHPR